MKAILRFFLIVMVAGITPLTAQVPNEISWQGVLTDAQGNALQGQNEVIVRIMASDDTINDIIPLWADTLDLDIEDGLVNVTLGSNPANPLNLNFDQGYWLEIVVNNGNPLSRIKMTSAPYSLMSRTVEDGAITTPKIANQAVTTAKIADNAVTTPKITDGGVTTPKIADNAISTAKLQDLAVTTGKLGNASVSTAKIQDNAVTASKIAAGAVRGSAPGATAPAGQIEGASISGADIANNQVVRSIGNPAALRDNVNLVPGPNVTITNNSPGPQDILIDALGQIKIEVNVDNSISIFIWNPQFNIFNLWIIIWPNGHIWWFHRLIIYETIIVCDPDSDGGVEINPLEGIILRDPDGEVVGRWRLDGTSEHMGEETFHGGIRIPLVGGGEILIDDQGITIYDDEGNPVTDFAPDGTSLHTGKETFTGGIEIPLPDGGKIVIGDDGITVRDSDDNVVGGINPDGSIIGGGAGGTIEIPLTGGGKVVIDSDGIRILDDEDNVMTEFKPDGTSMHKGLEQFEGGIYIPLANGGFIVIDQNGIRQYNELENLLYEQAIDGTSYHSGNETFAGGITIPLEGGGKVVIDGSGIKVLDDLDNVMTEFKPDGTSTHAGTETFNGGISIPLVGGGELIIDSEGITIFDSDGLGVTSFFPDGTSTHLGTETFLGGIEVPTSQTLIGLGKIRIDENGITITDDDGNVVAELNSDGTSYHSGLETFAGGIRVPLSGGGEAWFDESGIRIYDDIGNEMLVIGEDGSIRKDTDTGGWIRIDETGIAIYDDEGNVVTHFAPDGSSYHTGFEVFTGGIQAGPQIQTPALQSQQIQTEIIQMNLTNPSMPPPIQINNLMGSILQLNYNGSLSGNNLNFMGGNFNELSAGTVEGGLGAFETLLGGDFEFDGDGTVGGNLAVLSNLTANEAEFNNAVTEALAAIEAALGSAEIENNCNVGGDLNVLGEKNFRIDHPDDPYNKYLFHASIESDDVLNQYSGNVITDANGVAIVTLPDYVQKINIDFRYQLTVIGVFAQAIISKEISNNTFEIKTDKPNVKVSWQITAKRNDSVLKSKPFRAIREKEGDARGKLLFNQNTTR